MAGIGHNSTRRGTMYAIVFDLDQETLGNLCHGNTASNAYADIRRFLTQRGFEWKQGSTYFGDETVDAVRCVTVVQKLRQKIRLVHAFAPKTYACCESKRTTISR